MRITHNMMSYNYLNSLNDSLEKQSKIQEQLADGKCIHRPSDNPVKAVRSLKYSTSLAKNTQFSQNLSDAQSWMNSTDKVMSDLSTVMIKVKQLVTSADDTKTASDINTIGKQIDEMVNQVVSLANTQVGDRYIFGGQNDSTKPFERKTIKDPNSDKTMDVVVYNGNTSKVSMPIQDGEVNPFQDSVNLTGTDVFGKMTNVCGQPTVSVLNDLLEIKNEMMKTSTVSQTNKTGGVGIVSGSYNGAGYTGYDVRVDKVDAATGQVFGASYSKDGGNTWVSVGSTGSGATLATASDSSVITFSDGTNFSIANKKLEIAQTNTAGVKSSVSGKSTNGYQIRVDSKTVGGVVNGVSYYNDQTAAWVTCSLTNVSGTTDVALPGGQVYHMKDADVSTGDTYYKVTSTVDANYKVRVDSLSGGNVGTASYSTDDGKTWSSIAATDISASGTITNITLPSGMVLKVDATAGTNSAGDTYTVGTGNNTQNVYSFRVPQTAFSVTQSSSKVPANNSYVTGSYTGTGDTSYVVKVGSVDSATGKVLSAKYSTDKGETWADVPKITAGNPSVMELTNGVKLNIKADANNAVNDTYTFALPQGKGPDTSWISNVALKYVQDDHNMQLKVQTQLGARMSMYEMADNMMDDEKTIITTDQASNDGLDMAQAITDYNTSQNVYRASLAVGSKILQTSLVDFLK